MREFVLGLASFHISEGKLLSCEVVGIFTQRKLNKVIFNLTKTGVCYFSLQVFFHQLVRISPTLI